MDNHKPAETVKKVEKEAAKPAVAPTIKPEEIDEPILQENPQRFVLFPIKYHEVCFAHTPPRTRLDA
jgi:ribonucleoside-diphosphate reductase subunit M2